MVPSIGTLMLVVRSRTNAKRRPLVQARPVHPQLRTSRSYRSRYQDTTKDVVVSTALPLNPWSTREQQLGSRLKRNSQKKSEKVSRPTQVRRLIDTLRKGLCEREADTQTPARHTLVITLGATMPDCERQGNEGRHQVPPPLGPRRGQGREQTSRRACPGASKKSCAGNAKRK